MKLKTILLLGAAMLLAAQSKAQFTFGVSTGIGINAASFGYKVNSKLVPFIGFQYVHANINYRESGQRWDYDLYRVENYTEEMEIKGELYLPNLGAKYFIKQNEKLQAYLILNLAKPIVRGKVTYDGEEEDFNDIIKNTKVWAGELGFGVEYFLDEQFSVGGEFGVRYFRFKYEDTYDSDYYNPTTDTYVTTQIKNFYKVAINPTYTRIALNYYF